MTYINILFQIYFDSNNPTVKKRLKRILNLYDSYNAGLRKINNSNSDFSRNSTVKNILNWLNQYETQLSSISREIEQDKNQEKSRKKNLSSKENFIKTSINGGYETDQIIEYRLNKKTNKFEQTKHLYIKSKLYFQKNDYAFKRGSNNWLYANWTFIKTDKINKKHYFYDNYGQELVIDLKNNSIIWYMDRDKNNVFQIKIKYTNLTRNNSIIVK